MIIYNDNIKKQYRYSNKYNKFNHKFEFSMQDMTY